MVMVECACRLRSCRERYRKDIRVDRGIDVPVGLDAEAERAGSTFEMEGDG